jgi:hypothetical protein
VRFGLRAGICRKSAVAERDRLAAFGIRVGARRLSDAATCLAMLGLTKAPSIAAEQAEVPNGGQIFPRRC